MENYNAGGRLKANQNIMTSALRICRNMSPHRRAFDLLLDGLCVELRYKYLNISCRYRKTLVYFLLKVNPADGRKNTFGFRDPSISNHLPAREPLAR
ncbi:hypothetical protein EVAR_62890_1 [Eumeta japonica]|uniref:Uncharacterized protein n=1 Tax=Eumeta variegata TaxID=151549 RepID=A0A4C1ZWN5_EUMVA|nr:hypothetical protein EVAR_62890_1 [Eumeta japonica]